ncbi:unnamed protein product [Protopolystoma xenopodis]|uniref:Uncharacterized protein n=1 Tax=Protopolystoma xenopodis TaxID=117903 RepID=A0A3S5ASU2_9PLAT|nr:unnamed protein product [Protopolystoma xenopodis]
MSQPLLDLASTTSSSPVSVLSSSGINSSNLLLLKPRHADHVVPARPEQLERCPVALFETYCARRPLTTGLPHSPFYLQPDREFCSSPLPPGYRSTANSDSNSATNSNYAAPITSDAAGLPGVWYLASAMGKNKIGSLMNSALQRLGLPINRQVTLVRFCDSLVAAAALPLPNGEVIAQVFGHV